MRYSGLKHISVIISFRIYHHCKVYEQRTPHFGENIILWNITYYTKKKIQAKRTSSPTLHTFIWHACSTSASDLMIFSISGKHPKHLHWKWLATESYKQWTPGSTSHIGKNKCCFAALFTRTLHSICLHRMISSSFLASVSVLSLWAVALTLPFHLFPFSLQKLMWERSSQNHKPEPFN